MVAVVVHVAAAAVAVVHAAEVAADMAAVDIPVVTSSQPDIRDEPRRSEAGLFSTEQLDIGRTQRRSDCLNLNIPLSSRDEAPAYPLPCEL